MIVLTFSIIDKDSREKLFIKSFLLANVKLDIVFEIKFLMISNIDIDFLAQDL